MSLDNMPTVGGVKIEIVGDYAPFLADLEKAKRSQITFVIEVDKTKQAFKAAEDAANQQARSFKRNADENQKATRQMSGEMEEMVEAINRVRKADEEAAKASKKASQDQVRATKDVEQALKQQEQTTQQVGKTAKEVAREQREAERQKKQAAIEMQKELRAEQEILTNVGTAGVAAFALIAFAIGQAIATLAQYDQQLANLRSVTKVTAEQLQQVKDAAETVGPAYGQLPATVAEATTEFVKAGVDLNRLANGEIKDAMSLMVAGELEVGDAAAYASGALNTYKQEQLSLKKVADVAAGAANASATSVREMIYANQALGPVAEMANQKFEDVNATLAVFANNNLRGSDAGTSLKTSLLMLVKPTDEAARTMKALGLEFFDSQGKMKSLADIAEMLKTKLAGYNDRAKEMILATLVGQDGIRAMGILAKEGAAGIEEMKKQMSQVTAEETAKTKLDSINGSLKILRAEAAVAGAKFAETFVPAFTAVTGALTELLHGYNQLDDGTRAFINTTIGVTGAVAGTIGVLALTTVAFTKLTAAVRTSSLAMTLLERHPLILALSAVIGVVAAVASHYTNAAQAAKELAEAQSELNQRMEEARTTTDSQRYQELRQEAQQIEELGRQYESLKRQRDALQEKTVLKNGVDYREMDKAREELEKVNVQLDEHIKKMGAAGVTVENWQRSLGEFNRKLAENHKGILEATRAEVEGLIVKRDSINEINSLTAEYQRSAAATADNSEAVQEHNSLVDKLRSLIPGLVVAIDSHGKVTIQNTELIKNKVTVLESEINAQKQGVIATLESEKAKLDIEAKSIEQRIKNYQTLTEARAAMERGDMSETEWYYETQGRTNAEKELANNRVLAGEFSEYMRKIQDGSALARPNVSSGTKDFTIPEKEKAPKKGKSAEELEREADQARRESYDRDMAYSKRLLDTGEIDQLKYVKRLRDIRGSYFDWLKKNTEELYQLDSTISKTEADAAFKRVEDRKKLWEDQGRSAQEIAQMEVESYTWIAGQETFLADDRRRAEEALQAAKKELRGSTFQVSLDWIEQEEQAMKDAGKSELDIVKMKYDAWNRINSRKGQGIYNIEDEKRATSELANAYRELVDVLANDLRRARELDAKLSIEAAEQEAKAAEKAMEKRHRAEEKEIEDRIKALDRQAEAEKSIADQQERQREIAELEATRARIAAVLDHEIIMMENGKLVKKLVADQEKLDEIDKQLADKRKEAAQKERDDHLRAERQKLQDELDAKRAANETELQELREKNEQKLAALRTWWETQLSEEKINSDFREAINRDGMKNVLENIKTYLGSVETEYQATQDRIMRLGGLIPPSAGQIGSGPTTTTDEAPYSAGKGTEIDLAKEQMRRNSEAWARTTDPAERDRLHRENVRIGTGIGGQYDDSSGRWTFPSFPDGGIMPEPGHPKTVDGDHALAWLKPGELVLNQPQQTRLFQLFGALLSFDRMERQMAAALSYQPPTITQSTVISGGSRRNAPLIGELHVHSNATDPKAVAREIMPQVERFVDRKLDEDIFGMPTT